MDNIQTDEELFGTYFTNPPKMLTLDDVFDYVRELKDLKDKFVLEIMSTDDENRRNELAQEVHKITNYCAWMDNEESFMNWYFYYRFGESPPHIDWMEVITKIINGKR